MLLQHAIRYHEANDWIRQQDPATLTYKTLLQHCKHLEQCKHFIKAQQKGRADLTSLGTAKTTNTIHQDAITTHPSHNTCYRCGYSYISRECPAIGQRCHNCNVMNHFTALCRSRREYNRHSRHSQRETHRSRHSSRSSSRSSSRNRSSRLSSRNRSHNRCTRRHRSPTPHPIDTITTTQDFIASNSDTEGRSHRG